MYDNFLSFNADKTNYMIFKTRQQIHINLNPIMVNNTNVKQTKSTRYLDLIIGQELRWKAHVKVTKKTNFFLISLCYETPNTVSPKQTRKHSTSHIFTHI